MNTNYFGVKLFFFNTKSASAGLFRRNIFCRSRNLSFNLISMLLSEYAFHQCLWLWLYMALWWHVKYSFPLIWKNPFLNQTNKQANNIPHPQTNNSWKTTQTRTNCRKISACIFTQHDFFFPLLFQTMK